MLFLRPVFCPFLKQSACDDKSVVCGISFFLKKGLTFEMLSVVCAPLFEGWTSAPRGTENFFFDFFSKRG